MSQVWFVTGGLIAGVVAIMQFGMFYPGVSDWVLWPSTIVSSVIGMVLWYYSPLPNHNDPMMGDFGMYWGFSKPDEEGEG